MFSDLLKIGSGFERLLFFLVISLVMIHIVGCLWIIIPQFVGEEEGGGAQASWIDKVKDENLTEGGLYWTSVYWCVQTVTTVGYGDIPGTNSLERIFCSIIMVLGVCSFSFVNGSLASVLSSYDSQHLKFQTKIKTLNSFKKEFEMDLPLYISVKKNLELSGTNTMKTKEIQEFIDSRPHKLKVSLSMYIHESRYKKINFLRDQSNQFITWLCPLLKPIPYS